MPMLYILDEEGRLAKNKEGRSYTFELFKSHMVEKDRDTWTLILVCYLAGFTPSLNIPWYHGLVEVTRIRRGYYGSDFIPDQLVIAVGTLGRKIALRLTRGWPFISLKYIRESI